MDTSAKIPCEGGSGGKKDKNQNIQVFVRVRPMNTQESSKSSTQVIDTPGSREVVVRERSVASVTKTFTFDRVFGPRSKQVDVYKTVVAPLLAEVLLGYNCTVFAYGQTGTGKTFTMEGERSQKSTNPVEIDPQSGILPRALSQLFDEVRLMNCEFTVRVSFLELYNEELFDLLAPLEESKTKTLRIYEDTNRKGSVIIQGLEEVIVNNKQEVYSVLDRGSQQRKTAATLMNASSSRSHTIFTITVHLKESSVEGEEMLKIGKLHLVDLAGSENIGKSGAVDKRAREAGSINQSLLTLGRVISALVERTPHVPYRESKLTRLLQDSLGGKTKTSIIATVSPASTNIEETLSTLDYAHRAKNIMNKPEVNQKLTKKEALNIYTDEIERLRRDLNATRDKNGIFMDTENYNRTIAQIQAQHVELNEKSNKIKELEELLAEKEEAERVTAMEMDELRVDLQIKQSMLDEAKSLQQTLHKKIMNEEKRADELKYLVKYHLEAEEKMTDEASGLLSTASDSIKVIESLHNRLDRKQTIEDRNCTNAVRFRDEFRKMMDDIISLVGQLREGHTLSISEIRDKFNCHSNQRSDLMDEFSHVMKVHSAALQALNEEMLDNVGKNVDRMENTSSTVTGNILNHCDVARDTTRNKMNTIMASVELLRKLFHCLHSDNLVLEKSIADEFTNMSKEVKSVITSNTNIFDRLNTVLCEMKRKWFDIYTDGMESYKTFNSNQNKYQEECNKKIDEMRQELDFFKQKAIGMQETLLQMKTETTENCRSSNHAFKQLVSDVDKARQITEPVLIDSCKSILDAKQLATALNTQMTDFEEKNVGQHKNFLNGLNQKVMNEMQTLHKIEETSKSVLSDERCSLSKVTKAVKGSQQQFASEIKNLGNEMRRGIQTHSAKATTFQSNCSSAVNAMHDAEVEHSEELLEVFNTQCDRVSTSVTKVNNMLQHATGNVDEFWEQTYLVDSPTGGTPMRRRYDIPSKLTLPSPHERVMARYRAVSKQVQLAIEDLAKGGDDLDCSWSDNYFRNLEVPVTNKGDGVDGPLEGTDAEGKGDDAENENPTESQSDLKLETIAESVEPQPKENGGDSECSSVVSSDEMYTPRVQSHKVQPTAATTGKKSKVKPKYFTKKGILKPPN